VGVEKFALTKWRPACETLPPDIKSVNQHHPIYWPLTAYLAR